VRSLSGVKKVGHAGTLDPLASGVLLVCVGRRITRQVPRLQALEKEYEGTILLGIQTDTDDLEGKVIQEKTVPHQTREDVQRVLREFTGEILQVPPVFSALVVKGKKSYHLARRGKGVQPQSRKAFVKSIDILSFDPPRIGLRVVCGKGTYIRALARDLGERLGTCGVLEKLVRTRIGPYELKQSWTLDALAGAAREGRFEDALMALP
jgi:tRNA pseudouridine55 synthase